MGRAGTATDAATATMEEAHREASSGNRLGEAILGLMFINQGLGMACVGALALGPGWLLPGSSLLLWSIGGALCAVGLTVKVWATLVAGVDVYYYRDMFLRRPVSKFVVSGPYRVLRNPMYGVGQLHAYGIAILMSRSWNGLMAAAVCHALIYVFYFRAELPFIRRTYLTRVSATPSPENLLSYARRSDG